MDMTPDELAAEYQATGNNAYRDELFRQFTPLAESLARQFYRRQPRRYRRYEYADVLQHIFWTWLQILDAYDPQRGRVNAYLSAKARFMWLDELRRSDLVKRNDRRHMAALEKLKQALRDELGEEPAEWEVVERLGMSQDTYLRHLRKVADIRENSLVIPTTAETDDPVPWPNALVTRPEDAPERSVERDDLWAAVVAGMPYADKQLVWWYYRDSMTMSQIAELAGCCESRVSQRMANLVQQLKSRWQHRPHALGFTPPKPA